MKVQVYSRRELRAFAKKPFSEQTAVISIRDSDAPPVELDHAPAFLLELVFDDIYFDSFFEDEDTMPVIHFSERMAKEVIDFVSGCKDQVDTIICQCELGQSGARRLQRQYRNG